MLVCCTGEGEETEEGYTNGYTDTDVTDDNMADDEESWEQVGPKKKSVFTRKVLFFFWHSFLLLTALKKHQFDYLSLT